jgi:peptidoglycan/LPS O-acetylase OafA/YrhL
MQTPKYLNQLFRQDPNYFNHIEGLRAIAAFWMILYHIAVFAPMFVTQSEFTTLFQHPFFKIVLSTSVSLDVFFVISGLVIGYALIKELKDTGAVDITRFFVRRCARVYPLYIIVILFCGLTYSTFHSAWSNILQINNFLPIQQQHIPWAWSLAVDFQFYAVFSIILWLISKGVLGKNACYTLTFAALILPIVSTTLIIKTHPLHPFSPNFYNLRSPESWDYVNMGFNQLYVRSGPFLYGVLTAYLLVHHRNKVHQFFQTIRKSTINLLSLSLLAIIVFLLANDPIWFLNQTKATWQTSIQWTLLIQRNLFSLLLCMLLLLAEFPKGIVITLSLKILNSPVWRPFGQLTFTTYMIHPLVIMIGYIIFFALHQTTTAVEYWKFGLWLVLLIYLISIPLYLFIEQPAMDHLKQKLRRPIREKEKLALASDS